jgi:hypothetical protein
MLNFLCADFLLRRFGIKYEDTIKSNSASWYKWPVFRLVLFISSKIRLGLCLAPLSLLWRNDGGKAAPYVTSLEWLRISCPPPPRRAVYHEKKRGLYFLYCLPQPVWSLERIHFQVNIVCLARKGKWHLTLKYEQFTCSIFIWLLHAWTVVVKLWLLLFVTIIIIVWWRTGTSCVIYINKSLYRILKPHVPEL